jgi:hypothetical protein
VKLTGETGFNKHDYLLNVGLLEFIEFVEFVELIRTED